MKNFLQPTWTNMASGIDMSGHLLHPCLSCPPLTELSISPMADPRLGDSTEEAQSW